MSRLRASRTRKELKGAYMHVHTLHPPTYRLHAVAHRPLLVALHRSIDTRMSGYGVSGGRTRRRSANGMNAHLEVGHPALDDRLDGRLAVVCIVIDQRAGQQPMI